MKASPIIKIASPIIKKLEFIKVDLIALNVKKKAYPRSLTKNDAMKIDCVSGSSRRLTTIGGGEIGAKYLLSIK